MYTLRHGAPPHGIVGNAGDLYIDNIAPTPNTVASLVPGAQNQKFYGLHREYRHNITRD